MWEPLGKALRSTHGNTGQPLKIMKITLGSHRLAELTPQLGAGTEATMVRLIEVFLDGY